MALLSQHTRTSNRAVGQRKRGLALTAALLASGCHNVSSVNSVGSNADVTATNRQASQLQSSSNQVKPVVYQMFTRLFGNTNQTNKPWGTLEENGVGKFADINDAALVGIKELGVSHVWYTGVLHHATATDYTDYGISNDDPEVVKGRAGSPYAVKDYYSVNPDLAVDPGNRMAEFKALIDRTHRHGMQVVIDIVPNHIARDYHSLGKPDGIADFGVNDDPSQEYARDNSFYYVTGQGFALPQWQPGFQPLGGEADPRIDGQFAEFPAKWTGNGARSAQPHYNDWYETVKVNYGVRPDGSHDFPSLPAGYDKKSAADHYAFWQQQDVPASWVKFRDIALFWLAQGVDGFRYDMAEMVPVEFWSYLNSHIKQVNPQAFLLAEIYNPKAYRDYIHLGKMDYLYDKVELYDTLKGIIQDKQSVDEIDAIQAGLADINQHMLHFLENHDEQRIASPEFAAKAENALPALVLSATIDQAPMMIYFGQEVGEPGAQDAGFGKASRTTIFDYFGVPHHQRWMNDGKFDGGKLSDSEQALRGYYAKVMQFSASHPALAGPFHSLQSANASNPNYPDKLYSFARWQGDKRLLISNNFSQTDGGKVRLQLDSELINAWQLTEGEYPLTDALANDSATLVVTADGAFVEAQFIPLQSRIWQL